MFKNFHLAPPPKTVDGLLAVPIDIESIVAVFTFDGRVPELWHKEPRLEAFGESGSTSRSVWS